MKATSSSFSVPWGGGLADDGGESRDARGPFQRSGPSPRPEHVVVDGDVGLADGVGGAAPGVLPQQHDVRQEQVVGLVAAHGPVLRGLVQQFGYLVPVRDGPGQEDLGAAHSQTEPGQSPSGVGGPPLVFGADDVASLLERVSWPASNRAWPDFSSVMSDSIQSSLLTTISMTFTI